MVKNFVQGADVGSKNKVYSGISWQCVEYARRWWILKLGIIFGSVDTADEIFKLNEAERISDGRKIKLTSFENSSKRPPSFGDLLIYDKKKNNPNFQYGHVAVIVGINLNKGYIEIAEQNYDNRKWENKKRFSRRIVIIWKDNTYTIRDINFKDFNANKSLESSNRILGWVRALLESP